MKEIKEQIKEVRTNARLTQSQFAEKLGISLPTVSGWEQKGRIPRIYNIWQIEMVFKCKIELPKNFENTIGIPRPLNSREIIVKKMLLRENEELKNKLDNITASENRLAEENVKLLNEIMELKVKLITAEYEHKKKTYIQTK